MEKQARNCWENCLLWITEAEYWLIWLVQGKRYALPNTRIMLHHPSGSARGQASDINNEVVVFPTNANGNVAPKRIVGGPTSSLEACGTVIVF